MYKLLLVDDEWTQRYALIKMLRDYDQAFVVSAECENGEEALQALEEQNFDVIITDIRMPVMDGIRLLQEIRERGLDTTVVLVSTHSDFEYARKGIKYDAFDYLVKPIAKDKIASLLQQIKLDIEEKAKTRNIKEKLEQVLIEKLDFGLINNYEDTIFSVLYNSSQEVDLYIEQLIKYHLAMYDNDYFKLGVMFEKLIRNTEEKLLNKHPFIKKLYQPSEFTKDRIISNNSESKITEIIRMEFLHISDFIQRFHLSTSDDVIYKMCSEVLSKLGQKITLEKVALRLNYNSDYLGRLFKANTGESFLQFCTRAKLEFATILLTDKHYKTYEISELLGYKDAEYFSKLYREYTGVFPSEFRKTYFVR
ncbi:MAG: two component transcriptional regulator, AraC family [Herbinix sp.]|jgi:two-component system response regulator YesN|nr:two component transcriptional regulator, AraC family [Herbinix sp.]